MKRINKGILIGIIVVLAGIVCVVLSIFMNDSVEGKLSSFPVVETEAQLREAIAGEPQTVIVMNAPLTGEVCEDPLGILTKDYVALEYRLYRYGRSSHKDSWVLRQTETRRGGSLTVYGDIPLEAEDYEPYTVNIDLTDGNIKAGSAGSVDTEFTSRYYPDRPGKFTGNEYYRIAGIEQGSETTFLAEAGNGKLTLKALKNGALPPICGKNDMSTLSYALDENVGMFAAIGFGLVISGLFICAIAGVIVIANRAKRGGKEYMY